ncbi:hypothetical protein Syun_030142 [Stephania yunnanensis]|uniref:Uncharacterized protein n=1 Tax=Stephania yunnanensis TaxID=152371 RepID=A0AAP0HGQ9_9MAGN
MNSSASSGSREERLAGAATSRANSSEADGGAIGGRAVLGSGRRRGAGRKAAARLQ